METGFPQGGKQQGLPRKGSSYAASHHQCEICGKFGHFPKQCTNAPHPEPRMSNLPRAAVRKVSTLEGIDVSNRTYIKNSDGTYDIFEPSLAGLDQIKRDNQYAKLNLADVPAHLKCALSGALLTEAVELPCCKKIVNDSVIRESLLKSSLKCPLCSTPNISPESVSSFFEIPSLWFKVTHCLFFRRSFA